MLSEEEKAGSKYPSVVDSEDDRKGILDDMSKIRRTFSELASLTIARITIGEKQGDFMSSV